MTIAVKISDKLARDAGLHCRVDDRSVTGQIEYWAKIGKCAEDNPDLTYSMIKEILNGMDELDKGESTEYKFG